MITLRGIRNKIKQIKFSQRSSHSKIIEVLRDMTTIIEERAGKDPTLREVVKELGENEKRLLQSKDDEVG